MRVSVIWATVDPRPMAQPTSLFLRPASEPCPSSPDPWFRPSPDSASLDLRPQSLALAPHAYSPLLVALSFLTL